MLDRAIDWTAVEHDYRAGRPLAQITADRGVSVTAIRRRAEAGDWRRAPPALPGAQVAQAHRQLLGELRDTLCTVQQALRDHLTTPSEDGGPFGAKAETVAGLVGALGTTAERLIRLERQAFGLDHKTDRPSDGDGDHQDVRRRLESRLARLGLAGGAGGLPGQPEPG